MWSSVRLHCHLSIPALVFSAALMALRGKIWLAETASRTPEAVIGEIWQALAAEWPDNLGL